jgi:hypothetical protein
MDAGQPGALVKGRLPASESLRRGAATAVAANLCSPDQRRRPPCATESGLLLRKAHCPTYAIKIDGGSRLKRQREPAEPQPTYNHMGNAFMELLVRARVSWDGVEGALGNC